MRKGNLAEQFSQINRSLAEQYWHINLNLYGALEEKGHNLRHNYQSRCVCTLGFCCVHHILRMCLNKKQPRTIRKSGWLNCQIADKLLLWIENSALLRMLIFWKHTDFSWFCILMLRQYAQTEEYILIFAKSTHSFISS